MCKVLRVGTPWLARVKWARRRPLSEALLAGKIRRMESSTSNAAGNKALVMVRSKTMDSSTTIGFDAELWHTADKLRKNLDAAERKHVVLGFIFLKYISDTFDEHRAKLLSGQGGYAGAPAEDPDDANFPCLALRGIEADFGPEHVDTFRRDLRADSVLTDPPFNDSDRFRKDDFEAREPKIICSFGIAPDSAAP